MAAYGYSKRIVNEHGLHELSEVNLGVPLADLRRIAAFLIECADSAESGEWRNSHRHLTEYDRRWDKDHPESDVIVIHTHPEAPTQVG